MDPGEGPARLLEKWTGSWLVVSVTQLSVVKLLRILIKESMYSSSHCFSLLLPETTVLGKTSICLVTNTHDCFLAPCLSLT